MHAQSERDGPKIVPAQGDGSPHVSTEAEDSPLRVCFISPLGYGLYQPATALPFGGAELQFYLLSHELARDPRFHVSVLATVQDGSGQESYDRLTVVKRRGRGRLSPQDGNSQWAVFRAVPGYAAAFLDMVKAFREINADVYLHAGAGVEVGAYALSARLLGRRFMYVVASSADLDRANDLVTGPLRWLYGLGVRLADHVVCRTEEQLRLLRARFGRQGTLIRSGHPWTTEGSTQRNSILWVGRIHPLKQPGMFLDLAERLPAERYVMVAMPDRTHGELWKAVTERVARLPNLTFHENVPWSRIGRHFAEAKLFINTSTYEGFPNTFVQAAMSAVPILSWKVDPDGILLQHRIGDCARSSFEQLVGLVKALCARESERAEMGQRAKAYALRHHALDQVIEDWKRLLEPMKIGKSA